MINIAICDDDIKAIKEIENILSEYATLINIKILIHFFLNGKDLISFLENNYIDLLYLDIQMKNLTGIEVGKKIRQELYNDEIQIVYISAIKDYAMDLFQVRPNNFLIKPFSKEEVEETLSTAIRLINDKEKTFTFNIKGTEIKKRISEIIYFESMRHKMKVVTKDKDFEFYSSIFDVYYELADYGFALCHASYIVNIEHIEEYNKDKIKMSNGCFIKISRSKRNEFIEQIAKFDMNRG
ncbi:MAG: LytR/AlgR family response regulator transcription factor [Peptoanaerobacter stomatis]|uniref:LytR/AlgR family response regulator transcription factor n=1 Tax=Peptoanaerobacter stomatis TaxID=796937 RepID=UPI003F9F9209